MNLSRVRQSVLPNPRAPMTFRQVLPLVTFLVIYTGLVLANWLASAALAFAADALGVY